MMVKSIYPYTILFELEYFLCFIQQKALSNIDTNICKIILNRI